ncbi:hypothetical protein [Reichenbachiella versicolor]|uniref:hypothetical protein n=1 Tax=Reichenbachiella versicolor TaxID=1821036 RepID=UPI000D6DC95C|nr:hypothetical protein [Reichenbachiella versicolor]
MKELEADVELTTKIVGQGDYALLNGEPNHSYKLVIKNIDADTQASITVFFPTAGQIYEGQLAGNDSKTLEINDVGPQGLLVLNQRMGRSASIPKIEVEWTEED